MGNAALWHKLLRLRLYIARHLSCRPSFALYILLRMGNIETVLASSIVAVTWAAAVECDDGWRDVPDVLAFYDYVGHMPANILLHRYHTEGLDDG